MAIGLHAGNWPAWRGPTGDGVSKETDLPTEWSREDNVVWRTPLPEAGNSSPIVWNDRVFLTQPVKDGSRTTLLAFDVSNGELLWQSGVLHPADERTHNTNPYASASPATDGESVICWFGSAGVVAYDFEGNQLWKTDLGPLDHQFGYGSSPVIHENLVFVNFGPGTREFLVALDKADGREVWRHRSPVPGEDDIFGTWSTPFLTEWNGKTQLISAMRGELAGLEPTTGKVLWHTDEAGIQAKASPFAGEGVVVLSGDKSSKEIAVPLGMSGKIDRSDHLWVRNPAKRRLATGIVTDGYIYGVQTGGIADCVNLRTGEVVWQERLSAGSSNNAVWGSPVMVGDRIYIVNQSGDVFIYRATPEEYDLLASIPMKEPTNSSIAVSDGRLFIRTHEALWAIGNPDRR